jgi:hypothetical protein
MRGLLSALPGIFAILVLLGTIVFSIAAQMTDPPLEPALTLMRLQAIWGNGTYGPKFTFALTWFITLLALFGPLGVIAMCLGALRSGDSRVMPTWPRLEWPHMTEPTRASLGLALTIVALLFACGCLYDPEMFSPVGFLAQILLIFCPFALLAGPALLLDVALPSAVLRGPIVALERVPGASPQQATQHFATLGDKRLALPGALWKQLRVGDHVALRRSGGFQRELELARE